MTTVEVLRQFHGDLTALKRTVGAEKGKTINRKPIRDEAERLGAMWFSEVRPTLRDSQLPADTLQKYETACKRLVKISAPANRKSSYLDTLKALTKTLRPDLILPLQTTSTPEIEVSSFDRLFATLGTTEEDTYLKEAVACARKGLYRASAVLGWCAAVDRIHRAIEKAGFAKFNVTSAAMASQTQGRFKKFNKVQNVASMSDLRTVNDGDMLWILEGMQLIDVNQHTRLRGCFDLRNQSAHPGEAPVTEYNLLSFFSDVIEIVLKNPRFQVTSGVAAP